MSDWLCRRTFLRGCAAAGFLPAVVTGAASAQKIIAYHSDYFSFVGEDDEGLVAFAIDNNRGQFGDLYQADHFIEYFDDKRGFVRMKGDGRYPNNARTVTEIPPSEHWRVKGKPESGITLSSRNNELNLIVPPLAPIYRNTTAFGSFWVSSSNAKLTTGNREVDGRLIYEFIQFNDRNRLAGIRKGPWQNFNGLYVAIDGKYDLYFHHRDDPAPLAEQRAGFATWSEPSRITNLQPAPGESVKADDGSYHWPMTWGGTFSYQDNAYQYLMRARNRDVVHNWETGGFAMSIVDGEVWSVDGDERRQAVGYAELLI